MPNLGYETIQSEWIDHSDLRQAVREYCIGEVLNFPCGRSPIGDTRADIDASLEPDVVADVQNPPFDPYSFDTVYCDPPYSMFDFGESTEWVKSLYSIARKRLIVQGPNKALRVGAPADEELICLKPKPGSTKHWIRMLHIFTRPDGDLDDYR